MQLGIATQLAEELDPVHLRHVEVKEHDVRPPRCGEGDRGRAIARLARHHDVVLYLEQRPQTLPDHRMVVDEHNPRFSYTRRIHVCMEVF